ncbi:MAG: Hpt domain-containing protein, partial [Rhodospirillaceae bacterium]
MSYHPERYWTLYADEGGKYLDDAEQALLRLKENGSDAEAIAILFRSVHSFKGVSGTLNLKTIASRAHSTENLIELVRDYGVPFDRDLHDMLLDAIDTLHAMLERALSTHKDAVPAETVPLLRRMLALFERLRPAKQPEPETTPFIAGIFEPPSPAELGADPEFRQIFYDMARVSMMEMRSALTEFQTAPEALHSIIVREVERLRFAADRVALSDWPELLAAFPFGPEFAEPPKPTEIVALLDRMAELIARGSIILSLPSVSEVGTEMEHGLEDSSSRFFTELKLLLATLPGAGGRAVTGENLLSVLADRIQAIAGPSGFVQLMEIAERLVNETNPDTFREMECRFYQELAAIEWALRSNEASSWRAGAAAALQLWYAERVIDNLTAIEALILQGIPEEGGDLVCAR